MAKAVQTIPITQIILDEEIYPRGGVYPKLVSMFAENIRDGFNIDPIEVQIHRRLSAGVKKIVENMVYADENLTKLLREAIREAHSKE